MNAPRRGSRSASHARRGRSATLRLTVGLPLDGWGSVVVLTGIQHVRCLAGPLEQRAIAVALRVCGRGVKDVPATAHRALVVRHEQPKTVEPPQLKSDPARLACGESETPDDFVDRCPAHGSRSSIGRPRIPRLRPRPLITPFGTRERDTTWSARNGQVSRLWASRIVVWLRRTLTTRRSGQSLTGLTTPSSRANRADCSPPFRTVGATTVVAYER